MEVRVRTLDHVTVLTPDDAVDTRSALEFERKAVAAVNEPGKHLVVDFAKVDLITSAGLRVLVMVGKKLAKSQRRLVLCNINELVKSVLEVSGLTQAFTIAASEAEAIKLIGGAGAAPVPAGPSRLASQVIKLLSLGEAGEDAPAGAASLPAATADRLATHLVGLLAGRAAGPTSHR